jgi:VanZ family protein
VDEYIQLFSAGRSAQVNDVLLDFSGAVAGFVFFLIIHLIVRTIKKAKR